MRAHRLVIPRSSHGSVAPASAEPRTVDPPGLAGVRLVFGVGSAPEREPSVDDFHPVYTVAMPVFSPGGLDPDGIYEFDVGAQLELLRSRATERQWAVRVELELVQTREALSEAELWIEAPWTEDSGVTLMSLGEAGGRPLDTGGRVLIIASSPVGAVELAQRLGGSFRIQLRDVDPLLANTPGVESPVLEVAMDLSRYEFEDDERERPGLG